MLSQDESVAFRERNNGDQCISSRRGTALYVYVCTLKYKIFEGISLTGTCTDSRPVWSEGEG